MADHIGKGDQVSWQSHGGEAVHKPEALKKDSQ